MDRFAALAEQPLEWQRTAACFIVAANELAAIEAAATPSGFTWSDSGSNWPVLLLYATAAENLLKAIRIAQRQPAVEGAKLARYYRGHELCLSRSCSRSPSGPAAHHHAGRGGQAHRGAGGRPRHRGPGQRVHPQRDHLPELRRALPQPHLRGVIFKAKQAEFPNVKDYEGKVAQVRGVVQLYRGKPEIILNEPGQVRSPD